MLNFLYEYWTKAIYISNQGQQKHNEVEKVAHGSLKIFSESKSVHQFLGQLFTQRTRKKENEKWKPFARFHYKVVQVKSMTKKK